MKNILTLALCFLALGCDQLQECLEQGSINLSQCEAPPIGDSPADPNNDIAYFQTCQEVADFMITQWDRHCDQELSALSTGFVNSSCYPVSTIQEGTDPNNPSHESQPTNTQEQEIDEADRIKVSGKYIFYSRPRSIEVVDRVSKKWVQSLPTESLSQLFIYQNTLVSLSTHYPEAFVPTSYPRAQTQVVFYDVSGNINEIQRRTLPGAFYQGRLNTAGSLTLVSTEKISSYGGREQILQDLNDKLKSLDCHRIVRPGFDDFDDHFVHAYNFDLSGSDLKIDPTATHLLGLYDEMYMKKNLYLTKTHFSWDSDQQTSNTQKQVTRLELDRQHWEPHSRFSFRGNTVREWSYNEQDDYLFIASTQERTVNTPSSTSLNVYLKKKDKMILTGSVSGLAPDEHLRSVRFTKEYAYLVTFRTVDPLFVIDIRDKELPRLISELKVPGFSSYLHPVGSNELFGVGFSGDLNQLQLSWFNTSDPLNPQIKQQVLVGHGSWSSAQQDHRHFFYDKEWSLVALPVSLYNSLPLVTLDSIPQFQTGALIYRLDQDQIIKAGFITHQDWQQNICPSGNSSFLPAHSDISHVLRIDEALLSFSNFGLRQHHPDHPELEILNTRFSSLSDPCHPPVQETF